MTNIEAGTGALDLGAPELAHVSWEEDLGLVFEEKRAEELCVFRVTVQGAELVVCETFKRGDGEGGCGRRSGGDVVCRCLGFGRCVGCAKGVMRVGEVGSGRGVGSVRGVRGMRFVRCLRCVDCMRGIKYG